ncbi:MAG TPA: GAF domain-containing protein, partial [Anaerolineales bacterium]|nr:GAF domain-containing protein [Anaerolineales bacterium]
VDALKARVASLQAELEENRKKQAEAREAHPAGQSGMAEKKASRFDREMVSQSLSAKESQAAAAKHNSMNDQPSSLPDVKSSQATNAYRVLFVFITIQVLVLSFLFYETSQTPTWQLWAMDGLAVGLMISEIVGMIQVRRGRHELGIWISFTTFLIVLFVIPLMYSGMGAILMVSALTVTTLVGGQTLPWRQATIFIRLGIIVGIAIILVEFYIPFQRTALPGFQNLLYFALAFILPFLGYAILREFRDYSLRTKLVLGFVSILLLAGIVDALAIRQQFSAAEQTAVAEAGRVAETLGGVVVRNQVELQELIQQFHEKQQREARVIDLNQRILASIIPESIGTIYDADQHDEVTATLTDGQSRAFLETSAEYPQGLNLVVVPVKDEQTSIITGAVLLDYTQALQLASFAEADSFSREISATITKDPSDLQNFISTLSTARDQDLVVIDLQKQILADAKPENVGKTYNQDLGGEVAATLQDGQPRAFVEINVEHPRGIQQVVTPLKNLSGQIIGATVVGTSPESEQAAIAQAVQIAQTIGTAVSQNQARLQGLIAQMRETQQRDVKVIGTDLRILADAVPQNIGTIFAADQNSEVAATLSDGQSRTFVEVTKDNPQGLKHLVLPIKDESGRIISAVILDYTSIYDELQQSANTATRSLIGFGLAGLLLAFVISQIISTSIANPISKLSDAASKIGEGHLDTPLPAQTSQDEVGTLAGAFASMTTQLRGLIENMEQRVADRTHDLELAAVVVRTVTEKVSNVDDMLSEATELIRSSFDLYYTQVYLLDPTGHTITLRAGTGDVGQQLLRRGHHLLVNSGSLNGRAVSEKKPIIVADTAMNPSFLPNPLLPNTRSEMVVPLIVSGRVLGVLDMQSEIPGALNQSNLPAFAALAGQISIAIQNAALFAQSEESRKQMEENVRQITTAGWLDFLNGIDRGEKIGYVFDQTEVKAIERESNAQSITGLSMPITVTGATVGKIQVAQEEREWTSSESQIVQSTADQLAQHIENLRLLAQTEKYRQEAVQTTRRLTRIGWEGYLETRNALAAGYSFNPNEVKAEYQEMVMDPSSTLSLPINVRDEAIGELMINADNSDPEVVNEIFAAVAAQLGDHIENLRLLETTQYELAERTRTE